ncbi:MAG TPA: adenylyltransferase/cytidyltransferase family protein [archaeon]|nr:adenylyltransferase/cytidyltransferase family protein [archaeon]
MKPKTILAFGTFDLLHPGHISYLTQAKALGERLVVIIATDSNVFRVKGIKPVNGQQARRELVAALGLVDDAVVGFEDDMMKSVEKAKPDIVALGYDQRPDEDALRESFSARGIKAKIVRLKPHKPEMFKSSKIRQRIESLKK